MKNDITAVRNLLIAAMERILDPEEGDTFDVEKGKVMIGMGKVLVDSAKAEALYIRNAEKAGILLQGTGFIPNNQPELGPGKKKDNE